MLDFDSDEKQQIEWANQILLRLRKELHDQEAQFSARDVEEAAQSARWLREILEQRSGDWEQAFDGALGESDLPEEDKDYLRGVVEEAGGFLPFVERSLERLEEAAPDKREQPGQPTPEMTHQDLVCGVAGSLIAGGVMMGNFFYFGFGIGMSRKAECW